MSYSLKMFNLMTLAINFLNSVLALEYHTNQEGFFLEAQRQTREHAGSNAAYLELTKVLVIHTSLAVSTSSTVDPTGHPLKLTVHINSLQ